MMIGSAELPCFKGWIRQSSFAAISKSAQVSVALRALEYPKAYRLLSDRSLESQRAKFDAEMLAAASARADLTIDYVIDEISQYVKASRNVRIDIEEVMHWKSGYFYLSYSEQYHALLTKVRL
jgi:hypothetical protein